MMSLWLRGHLLFLLVLSTGLWTAPAAAQTTPDYADEAFVIERVAFDVSFAANGTGREERTARVRIMSDAAVAEFGILRFPYKRDSDRLDILSVTVRDANGAVITTPAEDVQDIASDVSRQAPMYTDEREKHVPVRGLRVGSTLEWKVRITHLKADAPGHFWYLHDFTSGLVVLEETLSISVPATKYVQVSSPAFEPQVTERNGTKTYTWRTAQTQPTTSAADDGDEDEPRRVQVTTFRNWAEVGQWYRALELPQRSQSAQIKAKAAELTATLQTDEEKQRAIYRYVATSFRYISLSFGAGRYQPHTADEVLSNAYGDCKDKHTLFAALMQAAGLPVASGLLSYTADLDEDVPSPLQFDHVVTYLPGGTQPAWTDTTTEVAAYGLLSMPLRGKRALVIPERGDAYVARVPDDPPLRSEERIVIAGRLTGEGGLSAQAEITLRGDTEMIMRNSFRATPRTRWAQMLSANPFYPVTAKDVTASELTAIDAPFRYGFAFDLAGTGAGAFLVPLPPMLPQRRDDIEPPKKPAQVWPPGIIRYRASLTLPAGFSADIPADVTVSNDIAEFTAAYELKDGVLDATRQLVTKRSRIAPDAWPAYQAIVRAVHDAERQFMQLTRGARAEGSAPPRTSRDATEKLFDVMKLAASDPDAAMTGLQEVERLNPTQRGLWAAYAALYGMEGRIDKATEALKKELEYHPDADETRDMLAQIYESRRDTDGAMAMWRALLASDPKSARAAVQLGALLIDRGDYGEAISVTRAAMAAGAADPSVELKLGEALLKSGNKAEGAAAILRVATADPVPALLNNAAYLLANGGVELEKATEMAARAVTVLTAAPSATLADVKQEDLNRVRTLTATWDTLGWAYFRRGDLPSAEKYIAAAWTWSQSGTIGSHLGQVYEAQGRRAEAMKAYEQSIAQTPSEDTERRYAALSGRRAIATGAGGDLARMRTTAVANTTRRQGTADFFLLVSASGVEDARYIEGEASLKELEPALRRLKPNLPFPEIGTARLVRRGILTCPSQTSDCQLILILPADARLPRENR